MAARSGLWGPCPISPAANPANPAPSANRSSTWLAGTSFALGFPYISTNWANRNSIPRALISFLTSSSDAGASPIDSPSLLSRLTRRAAHEPKLHDLHGDGQRQPVLALQIEAGQPFDPRQALAQGVRVDVQRARAP